MFIINIIYKFITSIYIIILFIILNLSCISFIKYTKYQEIGVPDYNLELDLYYYKTNKSLIPVYNDKSYCKLGVIPGAISGNSYVISDI